MVPSDRLRLLDRARQGSEPRWPQSALFTNHRPRRRLRSGSRPLLLRLHEAAKQQQIADGSVGDEAGVELLLIVAMSRLRTRDSTSLQVTSLRHTWLVAHEPTPQPAQSARGRLNITWLMFGGPPRSKANTISPTGSHLSSPS
jgi:hypothetical protein